MQAHLNRHALLFMGIVATWQHMTLVEAGLAEPVQGGYAVAGEGMHTHHLTHLCIVHLRACICACTHLCRRKRSKIAQRKEIAHYGLPTNAGL